MKALLLVLFAFAAILNVPAPCAHALGQAEGHAPAHSTPQKTAHAEGQHAHMHGHGSHGQANSTDASHTDEHHGCAEGCDGGANCIGCFMMTGATPAHLSVAKPLLAPSPQSFANNSADSAASGAEPPPPRA